MTKNKEIKKVKGVKIYEDKNKKKEVVRCTVYTRVSTENQAEKNYNSLESQKEHILNFIKSRKFEGWELSGIFNAFSSF